MEYFNINGHIQSAAQYDVNVFGSGKRLQTDRGPFVAASPWYMELWEFNRIYSIDIIFYKSACTVSADTAVHDNGISHCGRPPSFVNVSADDQPRPGS